MPGGLPRELQFQPHQNSMAGMAGGSAAEAPWFSQLLLSPAGVVAVAESPWSRPVTHQQSAVSLQHRCQMADASGRKDIYQSASASE